MGPDCVVLEKSWFRQFGCARFVYKALAPRRRPNKIKPPRFKKKSNGQSARFTRNSFRFKNGVLRLSKIGAIPIVWRRRVSGEPSSVEKSKPFSRRGRFTNGWLNQNGQWVCIVSQSTMIAR